MVQQQTEKESTAMDSSTSNGEIFINIEIHIKSIQRILLPMSQKVLRIYSLLIPKKKRKI